MAIKESPKALRVSTKSGAVYEMSSPRDDGYRDVSSTGRGNLKFRRAKVLGPSRNQPMGPTCYEDSDIEVGKGMVLQPDIFPLKRWRTSSITEIEEK